MDPIKLSRARRRALRALCEAAKEGRPSPRAAASLGLALMAVARSRDAKALDAAAAGYSRAAAIGRKA